MKYAEPNKPKTPLVCATAWSSNDSEDDHEHVREINQFSTYAKQSLPKNDIFEVLTQLPKHILGGNNISAISLGSNAQAIPLENSKQPCSINDESPWACSNVNRSASPPKIGNVRGVVTSYVDPWAAQYMEPVKARFSAGEPSISVKQHKVLGPVSGSSKRSDDTLLSTKEIQSDDKHLSALTNNLSLDKSLHISRRQTLQKQYSLTKETT